MKRFMFALLLAVVVTLLLVGVSAARGTDGGTLPHPTIDSAFAKWHATETSVPDISYPNPSEERRFKIFPCFRGCTPVP